MKVLPLLINRKWNLNSRLIRVLKSAFAILSSLRKQQCFVNAESALSIQDGIGRYFAYQKSQRWKLFHKVDRPPSQSRQNPLDVRSWSLLSEIMMIMTNTELPFYLPYDLSAVRNTFIIHICNFKFKLSVPKNTLHKTISIMTAIVDICTSNYLSMALGVICPRLVRVPESLTASPHLSLWIIKKKKTLTNYN